MSEATAEQGHCTWCGALTEEATDLAEQLAEVQEEAAEFLDRLEAAEQLSARLMAELENTAKLEPDEVPSYVGGLLAGLRLVDHG